MNTLFLNNLTEISEGKSEYLRAMYLVEREEGGTTWVKFSACMLFKSILPKP